MNTSTPTPTPADIACRAYQIYQQRGCQPGHELDDWLQAQQELTSKMQATVKSAAPTPASPRAQSNGKKKPARVSTTELEAGTNPWEQPLTREPASR